MRSFRWVWILFSCLFLIGCGGGVTYPLYLRYQPSKEFSGLQQKMGSTLAMTAFKDERRERFYIGTHTPFQGSMNHFKNSPHPLEEALQESLIQVLSRHGIKTQPYPDWDGKPESLRDLETDSILQFRIKEFWTQGRATAFGTRVRTLIHIVIDLGVKRERKVYTRNVNVEKEVTVSRSTPDRVEEIINKILADIFDGYFSNPY